MYYATVFCLLRIDNNGVVHVSIDSLIADTEIISAKKNNNNNNNDILRVQENRDSPENVEHPVVKDDDEASENDNSNQTSGVDSEIAGVAQVLYDTLADMPMDKESSDASDDDNGKSIDDEESNNDNIIFEDMYHPNDHPN